MYLRPKRVIALLFLSAAASLPLSAFSNNNVRVDRFKWMKIQTDHFDIYYDKSTELLLPRMAHYLEGAWREVGDRFGYHVPGRTPFFFYSNHNEFEQTNIVPVGEGTGGVTEAFKNRFVIFNDGSETWMKHVIYHEFTHVLQFNILYGGFWKSVRLLKSPFYPLWAMEGAAEYGSGDIDAPTGDMVVRDAFAHKELPSLAELQGFNHLKPNQITLGYKTGEAAVQFLKDEYGIEKFQKFLPVLKDHFDVSSALETLLGCDLTRFDFRFREWLEDRYDSFLSAARRADSYGTRITQPDMIPQSNEAPVISQNRRKVYFFSDQGGPAQLYEYDRVSKKERPLLGLKWGSIENIHTKGRALSISSDERWLAFAGEKKQRDYLYLFDLEKEKLTKIKVPFDQVRTPVFSPINDELVCVGMHRGFNDLYLINRKGKILERLTNSSQDERDPVFSLDGNSVVFSGEVMNEDRSEPVGWDLFSVERGLEGLTQLTDYPGSELEPEMMSDGSMVFVRDQNDKNEFGFNLYRLHISTSAEPLTNLIGGSFSPRRGPNGDLYFVAFEDGEKHIYQGTWTFVTRASEESVSLEEKEDLLGDPPLKNRQARVSWPTENGSPFFVETPKPYRLKGSTDLFLPFFLYSTQDGLVVVNLWQYSELLGNHQLQQQMQYASGDDLFDLSLFYSYTRLRPHFSLGFRGQKYFRDFDRERQRREMNAVGVMSYPLDRVQSVYAGLGVTDRKDSFLDESEPNTEFNDRFFISGFSYDSVTGRYLIPTKGSRLNLFYQNGVETAGGDQSYKTGGFEGVRYIPLQGESTWASRLFYGRSVGEDPQVFRLGGVDRIRALPGGIEGNKKSNVVFGSSELRLRIKYLNARTRFLFPDFFFKAAYLIVFDDLGYGWDTTVERRQFDRTRLNNSAGVGISWPTFILQTFQLNFTVQWARQTTKGKDVWYITIGPTY